MSLKVERHGKDKWYLVERQPNGTSLRLARFISLEAAMSWKFHHAAIQRTPGKTARTAR